MERAFPPASLDISLRFASLRQRGVSRDGYEGVELWIKPLYAAQTRSHQFNRRDLFTSYQLRGISQREIGWILRGRIPLSITRAVAGSGDQGRCCARQSSFHKRPPRRLTLIFSHCDPPRMRVMTG